MAVDAHGLTAEGNIHPRRVDGGVGPTATLLAAKLGAAAGGVLLYTRGVHGVLAGLTLLYAVGAIGPWLAHYSVL